MEAKYVAGLRTSIGASRVSWESNTSGAANSIGEDERGDNFRVCNLKGWKGMEEEEDNERSLGLEELQNGKGEADNNDDEIAIDRY